MPKNTAFWLLCCGSLVVAPAGFAYQGYPVQPNPGGGYHYPPRDYHPYQYGQPSHPQAAMPDYYRGQVTPNFAPAPGQGYRYPPAGHGGQGNYYAPPAPYWGGGNAMPSGGSYQYPPAGQVQNPYPSRPTMQPRGYDYDTDPLNGFPPRENAQWLDESQPNDWQSSGE